MLKNMKSWNIFTYPLWGVGLDAGGLLDGGQPLLNSAVELCFEILPDLWRRSIPIAPGEFILVGFKPNEFTEKTSNIF